ncbi:MAG: hypothetical protein IPK19_25165, partial [Chloroflexi bacterium]|nr:hypothetical protein [Chloroflexota bacterium]
QGGGGSIAPSSVSIASTSQARSALPDMLCGLNWRSLPGRFRKSSTVALAALPEVVGDDRLQHMVNQIQHAADPA